MIAKILTLLLIISMKTKLRTNEHKNNANNLIHCMHGQKVKKNWLTSKPAHSHLWIPSLLTSPSAHPCICFTPHTAILLLSSCTGGKM
ncbi:hypothetical protein EDD18DRAFT_1173735 [Armillaria luteobubalina]|uniref:Secreted protein n=1 Tax=Armillaria luteobubalina TaxID=153913 RepID=A0AA39Q2I9_9AGAR|nr:hypothetical protein EDD18DRAFT_1173735 [Armillaria luteobubalina]